MKYINKIYTGERVREDQIPSPQLPCRLHTFFSLFVQIDVKN